MTSAPVGGWGLLGTTTLGGDLAWNRFKTFRNVRGVYNIFVYAHNVILSRDNAIRQQYGERGSPNINL